MGAPSACSSTTRSHRQSSNSSSSGSHIVRADGTGTGARSADPVLGGAAEACSREAGGIAKAAAPTMVVATTAACRIVWWLLQWRPQQRRLVQK